MLLRALSLELPPQLNAADLGADQWRRVRVTTYPWEFTVTESPLTLLEQEQMGLILPETARRKAAKLEKRRAAARERSRNNHLLGDPDLMELSDLEENYRQHENAQRAKARFNRKGRMLCPDRLLTLTMRNATTSRSEWHRILTRFFRQLRLAGVDLAALIVDERHTKEGAANYGGWHSHLALNGFYDLNVLRACWHRALGAPGLMAGKDAPGNVDIQTHGGRTRLPYRKIMGYLLKYLMKTFAEGDLPPGARRWRQIGEISEPQEGTLYLTAAQAADLPRALGVVMGDRPITSQIDLATGGTAVVYLCPGPITQGLLVEMTDYPHLFPQPDLPSEG